MKISDIMGYISKIWNWIPDCLDFVKRTFSEDNGNPSYTRISSFCVLTNIMVNWSYIIFKTGVWVPLDGGTIALIGILVAGKVAQKFAEQNT